MTTLTLHDQDDGEFSQNVEIFSHLEQKKKCKKKILVAETSTVSGFFGFFFFDQRSRTPHKRYTKVTDMTRKFEAGDPP